LPNLGSIFDRISRVLSLNIKFIDLLRRKISSFLQPFKDDLGLKTKGVSVVRSALDRSIDTRLKEHHRHIRVELPDETAVVKHTESSSVSPCFISETVELVQNKYVEVLHKMVPGRLILVRVGAFYM
jgi:hypothetical protein